MKGRKTLPGCQVVKAVRCDAVAFPVSRKRGGTLIEVTMACVVLAVIAICGSAYVFRSQETLALHRERAMAIARVTSCIEELRAGGYRSLTQLMVTTPYYVVTNGGLAKLEFWPVPELGLAGTGREAVRITVQVTNRPPDYVSAVTIYSQEWRVP